MLRFFTQACSFVSFRSGLVQSNVQRVAGVSVYKRVPQYPKSFSSTNVPSGMYARNNLYAINFLKYFYLNAIPIEAQYITIH
jgi:hypothetical protein